MVVTALGNGNLFSTNPSPSPILAGEEVGKVFKCFTVEDSIVNAGIMVQTMTVSGTKSNFPAILVGDDDSPGFLQVYLSGKDLKTWKEFGSVLIKFAKVIDDDGYICLTACEIVNDDSQCIIVFRTSLGDRGADGVDNEHLGDWNGSGYFNEEEAIIENEFDGFPGEILVKAVLSHDQFGGGYGHQLIATVPKGRWFSIIHPGGSRNGSLVKFGTFNGLKVVVQSYYERHMQAFIDKLS